jgi:hypothetical protein
LFVAAQMIEIDQQPSTTVKVQHEEVVIEGIDIKNSNNNNAIVKLRHSQQLRRREHVDPVGVFSIGFERRFPRAHDLQHAAARE